MSWKNQDHYPIVIDDNAYVGMRASIISENKNFEGMYWKWCNSRCISELKRTRKCNSGWNPLYNNGKGR